jgi:hypothetical protein
MENHYQAAFFHVLYFTKMALSATRVRRSKYLTIQSSQILLLKYAVPCMDKLDSPKNSSIAVAEMPGLNDNSKGSAAQDPHRLEPTAQFVREIFLICTSPL